MAKIEWTFKNEEGTNLNRYIATNVSTGEKITFDLLRGGNISVIGTPLNAENLNALITSINACYDLISSSEKDTTYTLSKNGNAIRLTSSSGAINDVTLDKSDIGLGNVDNTSDLDKPISTATQQALDEVKEEFENHIVECNCTHETEITGFGEEDCNLAIDDQDVVITKIQGQTRRKSLNLLDSSMFKENDSLHNCSISISNEKITMDATGTDPYAEIYRNHSFPNGTYTISMETTGNGYVYVNGNYIEFKNIKTFTISDGNGFVLRLDGLDDIQTTFSNIMVVEGTYTKDTMPPFEPFDDTLVNSKCDFVSTSRNLLTIPNGATSSMACKLIGVVDTQNLKDKTLTLSGTFTKNGTNVIDGYGGLLLLQNDSGILETTDYATNFSNSFEHYELLKQELNTTFTMTKRYLLFICGSTGRYGSFNYTFTNFMLNYGDTALPYEPYIEDTMKCGLELGQWDYHDNINHITHRQTSKIWKWTSGTSIVESYTSLYGVRLRVKIVSDAVYGADEGVSNWGYNFNSISNPQGDIDSSICIFNQNLYIFVKGANNEAEARAVLNANPPQLVYKLSTETTEENILPSGYKVWYKGMQIQKTDTLPYILTKQYAISLASQVLNNVSVDRSQQKQIDELDNNKAPITRTINGHSLNKDINLSASDVGARPSNWTPNKNEVGLENVDNTKDSDKNVASAKILKNNEIGSFTMNNGIASGINLNRNSVYLIYGSHWNFIIRIGDKSNNSYVQSTVCYNKNNGKPLWFNYENNSTTGLILYLKTLTVDNDVQNYDYSETFYYQLLSTK